MASYFFIQSTDSIANSKTDEQFRLMKDLAERNNQVQVLLVQDGVYMANPDTYCSGIDALVSKGVDIYVDDFSLLQRGMAVTDVRPGLKPAPIGCVVDALLQKHKVIWN